MTPGRFPRALVSAVVATALRLRRPGRPARPRRPPPTRPRASTSATSAGSSGSTRCRSPSTWSTSRSGSPWACPCRPARGRRGILRAPRPAGRHPHRADREHHRRDGRARPAARRLFAGAHRPHLRPRGPAGGRASRPADVGVEPEFVPGDVGEVALTLPDDLRPRLTSAVGVQLFSASCELEDDAAAEIGTIDVVKQSSSMTGKVLKRPVRAPRHPRVRSAC